jgi:hypothetical protein
MKKIFILLTLLVFSLVGHSQNFTYSGFVYNSNSVGIPNIPIRVYKRTTPVMNGFTNQQNYNGHSYYRSTSSMTWTAARQACINMGGHLVTVTTPAENNFIFSLWPSGWIGLTDEVNEGQWRWVTGEPYSWSNWNIGEPNNAGNEDYVQFVSNGKWNDLPNTSLPYVLEFDYIVTFTPWVLETTVNTDANGRYNISLPTNPSVEWYIEIPNLSLPPLTTVDARSPTAISLNQSTINSRRFFLNDVNNDGRINVADSYYIYGRMNGRFINWPSNLPNYRIFTASQWNIINSSNTDLRATYPGVQTITITSPVNGGSSNFYITRTGYAN